MTLWNVIVQLRIASLLPPHINYIVAQHNLKFAACHIPDLYIINLTYIR